MEAPDQAEERALVSRAKRLDPDRPSGLSKVTFAR